MNKTLVISPTYNEAENIQKLIDSILLINDLSLLIIDDNSPDGTADIVLSNMKKNTNIYLISREQKLGLGTAYLEGFEWFLDSCFLLSFVDSVQESLYSFRLI